MSCYLESKKKKKTKLDAHKRLLKVNYNGARKDQRMPSQDFETICDKTLY